MTRDQDEQHKQRLEEQLRAALPRLPERLTRRGVCEAIGYEPDRGEGQRPATYRKIGAHAAPGAG